MTTLHSKGPDDDPRKDSCAETVALFDAANDGELVVCSHSITKDQRKA